MLKMRLHLECNLVTIMKKWYDRHTTIIDACDFVFCKYVQFFKGANVDKLIGFIRKPAQA